jgi:hypothetical protein
MPQHYDNLREQKRDLEVDQGPGLGAHTGRDRTRIPEHADQQHQGAKTTKANKDRVSRRD